MSGWDWIHAGLELATYSQAQSAQRNLAGMKTAEAMKDAQRILLEAMRNFIFDISRDIQLAEEQINISPQQVYIVSKTLAMRLNNSGLSPELFPDIQDKEYFFKTQKKIAEVLKQSMEILAPQLIQESDLAIKYVSEMPLLQQAIPAISAQESLQATEKEWQELSRHNASKKTFLVFGIAGLIVSLCVGLPLIGAALNNFGRGNNIIGGLFIIVLFGAILIGSIYMLVQGGKSTSDIEPLKTEREALQKKLVPQEDWNRIVSTFGHLTSEQFKKIYDERQAYLNPLLGSGL